MRCHTFCLVPCSSSASAPPSPPFHSLTLPPFVCASFLPPSAARHHGRPCRIPGWRSSAAATAAVSLRRCCCSSPRCSRCCSCAIPSSLRSVDPGSHPGYEFRSHFPDEIVDARSLPCADHGTHRLHATTLHTNRPCSGHLLRTTAVRRVSHRKQKEMTGA